MNSDNITPETIAGYGRGVRKMREQLEASKSASKTLTTEMVSADDFLNPYGFRLACSYLARRAMDLENFNDMLKGLPWTVEMFGGYPCAQTELYGNAVVRELVSSDPHSTPTWGTLFYSQPAKPALEPVVFQTYEQFAAYVLAKWW